MRRGDEGLPPLAGPRGGEPGELEEAVLVVLRAGVLGSLALVVIGMAVSLFHHPDYWGDATALPRLLRPSDGAHTLRDVGTRVLAFKGQAIAMLGLLVLIATPVLRVAVSVRHFARVRDRAYTWLTAIVLGLLLLSFLIGRAGGG
ncbi:MAG TPA: DUF1634 domain-containing protein [Candidatus Eisenbacteria bacterium]